MNTRQFLQMLKVASAKPMHIGDQLAQAMADPNATEQSAGWQNYIKDMEAKASKGLTGDAAKNAIAKHRQDNPNLYNFNYIRSQFQQAGRDYAAENKQWRKDNTGYFANASWNPMTWGMMGRQVDINAAAARQNALYDKIQHTDDPLERAKLTAQWQAGKQQWDKDYARFQKHVDAPLHVAKRVDEMSGIGWLRNKQIQLAGKVLGKDWRNLSDVVDTFSGIDPQHITADDLANEYGNAVYNYTGDVAKAQAAERKLRATGWGAAAAMGALESAALGSVAQSANIAGKAAPLLNYANKGTRWAKVVGGTAQGVAKGAQQWRFWHSALPVTQGISDVIRNGGKADPGMVGNFAANVADYATAYGKIAPAMSVAGGFGGGVVDAVAPNVAAKMTALSRMPWDKASNPASKGFLAYAKSHPGKTLVQLGKGRVMHAVTNGPVRGTMSTVDSMVNAKPLDWKPWTGFQNEIAINTAQRFGDWNDTLAIMHHGEDWQRALEQNHDIIRNDPEQMAALRSVMGLPDTADADAVIAAYDGAMGAERYQNILTQAAQQVDRNADPMGYSSALYKASRNEIVAGGPMSPELFTNPMLTQKQRKELLALHVRAEDMRLNGDIKANPIYQYLRDQKNGEDSPLVNGMRNSDSVRQSALAYCGSVLQESLESGKMDDMDADTRRYFKTIWGELDDSERRRLLSPLNTASVDQIMGMMANSGASDLDPSVGTMATDMLYKRLGSDAEFRNDFIAEFASGVGNGMNMSGKTKDMVLSYLETADPDILFKDMDDGQFKTFTRAILANTESGGGLLADIPEDRRNKIVANFTAAAKRKSWEVIKKDPIHNLPLMASLFAQRYGFSKVSEWLEKPGVFWGVGALLLLGGLWLGGAMLEGDDDDDEPGGGRRRNDARSMIDELKKQRELLADETV